MTRLNNLNRLKPRRRALRASLTPAEARLWKHLQSSQLDGKKFRRQHSVGPFILDFYCPSARLAVELDGAAHDSDAGQRRDEQRDRFMSNAGIRILRFQNQDVMKNLEGVLVEIRKHLSTSS